MSEKQKQNPKNTPTQKKNPEKKPQIEKKKETLKTKKEVKKEVRKEMTKVHLDTMKDELGHTVTAGENIWRLIYNHAKETGKTPIKPEKLEDINITVGDKVFFTKNEVIIKYIKGGTKRVSFEGGEKSKPKKQEKTVTTKEKKKTENTAISKNIPIPEKKQEKTIPNKTKYYPSIDSLDIALGTINETNLERNRKNEHKEKNNEKIVSTENKKPALTIFDPESPLKGDQIAYKHEIEIKNAYGKEIKEMIAIHCKGSLIDEDFFYGVIARESRFNKNAKSYTGVKGLGQITKDTVVTITNINDIKARKNPEHADFFITNEVRKFIPGKKKAEKGKYIVNESESLKPINQIKMTLSYLLYLEDLFSEIQNKKFKGEVIIASYNLGPGKTKEILNEYAGVKNWEGLKWALQRAAKNGDITKAKAKETTQYVEVVKDNIQKSKDIKLASL